MNTSKVVWLSWLAVAVIVFVAIYVLVFLVALLVRLLLAVLRSRRRGRPGPGATAPDDRVEPARARARR